MDICEGVKPLWVWKAACWAALSSRETSGTDHYIDTVERPLLAG